MKSNGLGKGERKRGGIEEKGRETDVKKKQ